MSDLHLHHDLYREAGSRRHREAEAWVRSRSLQRDARAARSHRAARNDGRIRLVTVLSPMVALAIVVAGIIVG